jgi:hypothetical protein
MWRNNFPKTGHVLRAGPCPRITREFLAEERRRLPDLWYRSEYLCEFTDNVDAVFAYDLIAAAESDEVEPLFVLPAADEGEECPALW